MGQPSGGELGMRQLVSLRAEKGGFAFKGLNLQKDAGSIGEGQLQEAVNVRLKGGRLLSRGGLSASGSPVTGEIVGLFDDQQDYVEP